MSAEARRREVLARLGASASEAEELIAYGAPGFQVRREHLEGAYPLPDEPCVAAWEGYSRRAARSGAFASLRGRLVQLSFPVAAGISHDPQYRASTRRGDPPPPGPGLALEAPGDLELRVHPTPAGRIPVLIAGSRHDFEALLCALTCRNEPEPVPPAVGATIVGGYNNWDRIRSLRVAWQAEHSGEDWTPAFRDLLPRKELYQDRFLLLAPGPYSGIDAAQVGLDGTAWLETSLRIRLEHEAVHYFTRRVLGQMRNGLHDEILADWTGLVAATGRFRADWFLRFLGVEDLPRLRPGGRLAAYRGDPPLSDGAFRVLAAVVVEAAAHLEAAERHRTGRWRDAAEQARTLCELARLSPEEMADEDGVERIADAFAAALSATR